MKRMIQKLSVLHENCAKECDTYSHTRALASMASRMERPSKEGSGSSVVFILVGIDVVDVPSVEAVGTRGNDDEDDDDESKRGKESDSVVPLFRSSSPGVSIFTIIIKSNSSNLCVGVSICVPRGDGRSLAKRRTGMSLYFLSGSGL